jgi:hypothetical protein
MYEHHGLGWSDIQGYPACQHYPGDGTQRCFIENSADEAVARQFHCVKMERTSDERTCETTEGSAGRRWCCPSIDMLTATPPRLVCESSRVSRSTLPAEARALWDVQKALCDRGLDPGAVDGTRSSPVALRTAVRAFQYNSMLPDTGELDSVTLRRLGFSGSHLTEMTRALAPDPGRFAITAEPLSWLPVVGFVMAGGFLTYVGYKYMTRRGR